MKKYTPIVLILLYSCVAARKPVKRTSLAPAAITMTLRQLTDFYLQQNLISKTQDSIQQRQDSLIRRQDSVIQKQDSIITQNSFDIEEIKKTSVTPDKSFKTDSTGALSLADTIFTTAIVTKGRLDVLVQKDSVPAQQKRILRFIH